MNGFRITAIVLAAGQGKRMGSAIHKQYLLLRYKPVLYYSLKVFEDSQIDDIILVVGKGEQKFCENEILNKYGFHKVRAIVEERNVIILWQMVFGQSAGTVSIY